jgi:hypothetical protein
MMPNASGSTPPPTPWTTRAMTIISRFVASAASRQPSASMDRASTNTRFLPVMSPSRPMIGVKIEADSR